MRLVLVTLLTIAATLAADVQSGNGQESFFTERYCAQPGGGMGSGAPDCSFRTWQQCIESARGLGRYCTENPSWRGPREQPTTQGRSRRRNR